MTNSTLYDDDILLWSEQQAEIVRRLGRTRRDLPDEFDVENVAEEIESVGRSELASVETQIRNILVHLIKLFSEPDSPAAGHRRGEIFAFHSDMVRRYAPSMRQRINIEKLWRSAREQIVLALPESDPIAAMLPDKPPFSLDDLIAERFDVRKLSETLHDAIAKKP